MAGAVAAVARRVLLVAAGFAATTGACAAPPVDLEEFERDTGVAAPAQPEFPAEGPPRRVPERRRSGGEERAPSGGGSTPGRISDATPLGFGDGASIVRSALSGRERMLVQVNLYEGYGIVTSRGAGGDVEWRVVRPDGPEEPLVLPDRDDLEGDAGRFGPTDVDWAVIPSLVEATPGSLGVDGSVSHVIVERNLPFSPDVVIRVYVSGADGGGGDGGRIDYFADGRPMRAFRDP